MTAQAGPGRRAPGPRRQPSRRAPAAGAVGRAGGGGRGRGGEGRGGNSGHTASSDPRPQAAAGRGRLAWRRPSQCPRPTRPKRENPPAPFPGSLRSAGPAGITSAPRRRVCRTGRRKRAPGPQAWPAVPHGDRDQIPQAAGMTRPARRGARADPRAPAHARRAAGRPFGAGPHNPEGNRPARKNTFPPAGNRVILKSQYGQLPLPNMVVSKS